MSRLCFHYIFQSCMLLLSRIIWLAYCVKFVRVFGFVSLCLSVSLYVYVCVCVHFRIVCFKFQVPSAIIILHCNLRWVCFLLLLLLSWKTTTYNTLMMEMVIDYDFFFSFFLLFIWLWPKSVANRFLSCRSNRYLYASTVHASILFCMHKRSDITVWSWFFSIYFLCVYLLAHIRMFAIVLGTTY